MSGRNYFAIIFFGSVILVLSYINYFTDYLAGNEILIAKIIQSLWIILIAYVIDSFVENTITKRVSDTKDRYTFRKVSSVIITLLAAGSILVVFMEETTTLIVAYGIFSAGVIITLQDVFRNFASGIIMLFSKSLRPGDRIQVDECFGDVIDVTYFHTTLMEIREWVGGDQYSGRMLDIPNSFILSKTVKNYTRDFLSYGMKSHNTGSRK
ncbi:MAG: mechanosensitive ion channel [Methanolobus sp.]